MKFTIWVDNSLVINTIHSLSEPCPWVEEKIFKEIRQFLTFYPKIIGGHIGTQFAWSMQKSREEFFLKEIHQFYIFNPNYLSFGWWVMNFKISCLLTLQICLVPVVKGWCTMHTTWWQMPTHRNRSPEWLRWPKNTSICAI